MAISRAKILVIVGPTASGKSDCAVRIAKQLNGEVISADSRQVYRGLDIGSAKITKTEMRGVPHHLIDVADPTRMYSVTKFQHAGKRAIRDILRRGKVPIIVGGTGFYIDALVYDLEFPKVKPDRALRKRLDRSTTEELLSMLKEIDPRRAETIDVMNRVRMIRAIEIATRFGPAQPLTTSTPYDPLWIGLSIDSGTLRERLRERILKRIRRGMFAEFRKLHDGGLSLERMESLGLEYRLGAQLISGKITREAFIDQLEKESVQYAKRQMTWFKRNKGIQWFTPSEQHAIVPFVQEWYR